MKSKEFSAETFEMYALQGAPSTIIVDRKGFCEMYLLAKTEI